MLRTRIGSIELPTPLILGSGHITETPDFFLRSQEFGCSGIVTRSLRTDVPPERSRVPAPRYHLIGESTMLNCEWSNEHPWTKWRDGWAQKVKTTGGILVVSLSGRDIESCQDLIRAFEPIPVDAFEINVSCSHSGAIHGNLNIDIEWLSKLLPRIRPLTRRPIWVKLSYSPVLVAMAQEAEKHGANAVVCTNTIGPGLALDIDTGQPILGIRGGAGGVSGKAIFPIALRCVFEIARNVNIPVVGVGGIFDAEDAIQMLMAGASAVQLYTAPSLLGPIVFQRIIDGIAHFLSTHQQFRSIGDIVGYSLKWGDIDHRFDAPHPLWHKERCIGCGRCRTVCHFDALTASINDEVVIDTSRCVSCTACVGICPRQAITVP